MAETELLREFFPDEDLFSGGVTLDLFERHFLLYRRLWQFDDELRLSTGQRLWIRGIRSTLLEAPPADRCDHLDEANGCFCLMPLPCRHHQAGPAALAEAASMKGYYLDLANLSTMTPERLASLVDGFFRWMGDAPAVTAALALFGVEADVTPAELKQRWKDLSKKNHPDRGGDVVAFQRLSAAWEVLQRSYFLAAKASPTVL